MNISYPYIKQNKTNYEQYFCETIHSKNYWKNIREMKIYQFSSKLKSLPYDYTLFGPGAQKEGFFYPTIGKPISLR